MRLTVLGSYAKALVVTADRIPVSGETLLGWDYRETFGGKGSDMVVQAARLGADVEFVGVVGQDAMGKEFLELMNAEGVGVEAVRTSSQQPTGVGLIIKDVGGDNIIVVDMGANKLLSNADIDAAWPLIKESEVVLAQLEIPIEPVLYGLKLAREAGATTILNPAPAVNLTDLDLQDVDVLTPNETEARVVIGLDPEDPTPNRAIAERILETGCKSVVMTLGSEGVAVFKAGDGEVTETLISAWDVDVVDTNGAGDSFNAGLAVALGEGRPLTEAADFGSATAALSCTKWETVPSYHTRNQVEKLMAAKGKNK